VALAYDLAAASSDGQASTPGFDGKGNTYPAEMLPSQIQFNDVSFQLATAKTGSPNALTAKGQTIELPAGRFNRVYILAASARGDQRATFTVGTKVADVTIQDWGGYIGQWDNRKWSSPDVSHDHYGDMVGLTAGFIKRSDLAWYASHHHDATGRNVDYSYSYLFAYGIDVPPGARTIPLPTNDAVRIMAISIANEDAAITPAHPLYDVLPAAAGGGRTQ